MAERPREDIGLELVRASSGNPQASRSPGAGIVLSVGYESHSPDLAAEVAGDLVSWFVQANADQPDPVAARDAESLALEAAHLSRNVADLEPALQCLKRHYHEKVAEEVAARCCGMSRYEFSRKFHAAFGMTFREHLLRARITEARRMLMEGDRSVTAIAYSVGFNDGSHFARMFRRYTHVLPSAYQMSGTGTHRLPLLPAGAPSQPPARRASDRRPADRGRAEAG